MDECLYVLLLIAVDLLMESIDSHCFSHSLLPMQSSCCYNLVVHQVWDMSRLLLVLLLLDLYESMMLNLRSNKNEILIRAVCILWISSIFYVLFHCIDSIYRHSVSISSNGNHAQE